MATINWSQDKFSQGELSPLMYARITVNSYYDALKTAKNVFTLPQGAATKRFGTRYLTQVITETDYTNVFFKSWMYLDECTYVVLVRPLAMDLYLEGKLQTTIPTTLVASDIQSIDHTVLNNRFRITTQFNQPFDIVRTYIKSLTITGFTVDTFTFSSSVLVVGTVSSVIFSGTVPPTSVPVITFGPTYYYRVITTSSIAIYANLANALSDTARFAPSAIGTAAVANMYHDALVTAFGSETIVIDRPLMTVNDISAVRFAIDVPTTNPQVRIEKTYFSKATTTTACELYLTSIDAENSANKIAVSGTGTGTQILFFNQFTLTDVVFSNTPVFDFNEVNYSADVFTPDAPVATTITATVSIFTAANIGGSFQGNNGVVKINSIVAGGFIANVSTVSPFYDASPIPGTLAVLTEPAWSATRGWPQKCSSYQSRSIFANSELLSNGVWLSTINNYNDFNDLETDDDSAISWYPTSDNINVVNFIVPYRSLTVHTNTGVYSTPLSQDAAITPTNFSLTLQDSTPATNVQPRTIDNQIIVLSGSDAHSLIFDGINNAYTTSMISVVNEHVLVDPIGEAEYRDLQEAGSRYMFVVNSDGSLAIYQTLLTENVSGWTKSVLDQSYGIANFRAITSNSDGRVWFMNERQIAEASAGINVTAFTDKDNATPNTWTATATNFEVQTVTAFKFTAIGAQVVTTPQIATGVYYWTVGIDANTFRVYLTQADAIADTGSVLIEPATVLGTTTVEPWPLVQRLEIEELNANGVVDSAGTYSGAATSTLTGAPRFNAQDIKINGNGYGFSAQGINDQILITAHGESVTVTQAEFGFPIDLIIEPLPLSIATGQNVQSSNLTEPKHIRNAHFMFNDTIGGTVNGVPIAVNNFNQVAIGAPPNPMQGIFEFSVMKGWNDFDNPTFTIEHNEPFNFRLLGIFYTLEV